jgi:hypothetical protein
MRAPFASDLNAPLPKVSQHDTVTLRDARAGVHRFGGMGTGKTSASGKMLASAYLRAGFGGVVPAVKPDNAPPEPEQDREQDTEMER